MGCRKGLGQKPKNCVSKKGRKRLREVNLQGPGRKEGGSMCKNIINADIPRMGEGNKEIIDAYKI